MARMKNGIRKIGAQHYEVDVSLGLDANGNRTRTRRTVHGPLSEAVALKAQLLAEKTEGRYVGRSTQKLGPYLRLWLEWKRPRVSGRTHERYSSLVEGIVPALGAIRLQDLTTTHLEDFYARSLEEPGQRKGSTLSPATVHHRHVVLKMALKRAVQLGLIVRNPADFAQPPRVKRVQLRVLDVAEAGRLMESSNDVGDLLPVFLALNTGARLGEILALRWSDVDLEGGTLVIRRTLVEPLKRGETEVWYSFKEPKSGRERTVDITAPTVVALRRHRSEQAAERLACGVAWANLDLVIIGTGGEPVRPSAVSTRFRSLVKALNRCSECKGTGQQEGNRCQACGGAGSTHEFEGLRFHDLRHSHGTILLRSGVAPHVVSQRLGHSTVAFTLDRYAHVLPGQQRQAAEAFDAALSGCAH